MRTDSPTFRCGLKVKLRGIHKVPFTAFTEEKKLAKVACV